jgi:hypothetical protein
MVIKGKEIFHRVLGEGLCKCVVVGSGRRLVIGVGEPAEVGRGLAGQPGQPWRNQAGDCGDQKVSPVGS